MQRLRRLHRRPLTGQPPGSAFDLGLQLGGLSAAAYLLLALAPIGVTLLASRRVDTFILIVSIALFAGLIGIAIPAAIVGGVSSLCIKAALGRLRPGSAWAAAGIGCAVCLPLALIASAAFWLWAFQHSAARGVAPAGELGGYLLFVGGPTLLYLLCAGVAGSTIYGWQRQPARS